MSKFKKTHSLLAIVMIFTISLSCKAQKNTKYKVLNNIEFTDMATDTFDINLFEKYSNVTNKLSNVRSATIEKENGEKEEQVISSEEITVYYTPPLPKLYWIYKEYYLNGKLKKKGYMLTNTYMKIGVWEYYDERGNKTTEDMDKRYSKAKFTYNQVMLLLQDLGHINIKTGEGRNHIDIDYLTDWNFWKVEIRNGSEPPFIYNINGKNGKVTDKYTIQFSE